MATQIELELPHLAKPAGASRRREENPLRMILAPLASLKLTLVLLLMAIFLIWAGTMAQAKAGMWEAIEHYFAAWFVLIDLQIFLPQAWFGESYPWVYDIVRPGMVLPFFGGASIGLAMLVNLLAAHALRFRSQARGTRLFAGIIALAAGMLFTWVVISLGDFQQGLRAQPLVSWETTALLTLVGAVASTCALAGASFWFGSTAYIHGEKRRWVQAALSGAGALFSLLGCVLLVAFFNDVSGLRILWQLIQGTMAGVVLLGGCWLVFDKRAGVVLLHGGIALMMLSQLFVNLWAVEERISVEEGDTATYAFDIRTSELAVVEQSEASEHHVVIPQGVLENALLPGAKRVISSDELPFDIEVLKFYKNSSLAEPKESDVENPADAGVGKEIIAVERPVGAGASSDSGVDMPAAYLRLTEKVSGKEIGTYLATTALHEDQIEFGGKTYDFGLRFKRSYKPYQITLKDAKRENYPGSSKPKNYESQIQLVDPSHNVDRPVKIWMNSPFRYLGETFYQSGMDVNPSNGKEYSVFQVVTNAGWMTPYVACMIVAVGLIYQFVQTLMKFILSEPREAMVAIGTAAGAIAGVHVMTTTAQVVDVSPTKGRREQKPRGMPPTLPERSWWSWFIPSGVAMGAIAVSLLVIGAGFFQPKAKVKGFDLYEFGRLPVVDQGRTKPLDSLARETLLGLSNRTTVRDEENRKTIPAIHWLLMTIARPEEADKLPIIRIEHPDVISALGLPEERTSMRFSLVELRSERASAELQKQLATLDNKKEEDFTLFEKKLAELSRRLQGHMRVQDSFVPQSLSLPDRAAVVARDPEAMQQAMQAVDRLQNFGRFVERRNPTLAVPVTTPALEAIAQERQWVPYSVAAMFAQFAQIMPAERSEVDTATKELTAIFDAYAKDDPDAFNEHVAAYHKWLDRREPDGFNGSKLNAESYLSHFAPFGFTQGMLLYLLALLMSLAGLVVFRRQLGSAAFWMLVIVFVMHSIALGTRIYISGRPPVTNLYSSAVFIGWAAVFIGLMLEGLFRLGVGNFIAALAGLISLLIANQLSLTERDTIGVMEAVLDTQFWLATHVVCITLGYASTFAAGLLGIGYIFRGMFTPDLNAREGKLLARVIYGVVCFALLFSFVGTVLGGLWADDSWGRFWGWDPKENGALIIVLWNAFILHAKWDKLANEQGLAVLAVIGNIVTSWSWFGTNLLSVGLHSYGFSKEIGAALAAAVVVHALIAAVGMLPKSLWWSFRQRDLNAKVEAA
jgi:ABC-type transport system involved in cytochrome c biogenesis permease subunit